MSLTPWSTSASITISAPLISFVIVRSSPAPFIAGFAPRIKKGPESPSCASPTRGLLLATLGDAPSNEHNDPHLDNKITHFSSVPSFPCAPYKAVHACGQAGLREISRRTSASAASGSLQVQPGIRLRNQVVCRLV